MAASGELVCPKCGGRMLLYERTGIAVEQCQDCRGIYLDMGELERLVEAEGGGWSGRVGAPSTATDHGRATSKAAREGVKKPGQREKVLRDLFGE
jgi:Zn-finger nucleic acid-binding protein